MDEQQRFGAYLRFLRERADLSLRALSKKAGVGFTYIGDLERGRSTRGDVTVPVNNPGRDIIKALADALTTAPPGVSHKERKRLFELAGYSEDDAQTLAKRYGLTPELARELASLPAARLLRVLEEVGGIRVRGPADDQQPPAEHEQTQDRRGQN